MNTKIFDPISKSKSDWQLLGELELPAGASVQDALYAWLTEILYSLNLPTDLLNKIIVSAHDATTRAIQAEIMHKFKHLHLKVKVPVVRSEADQAWGFFRLQKIEGAFGEDAGAEHTIEFYLYREA